MITPDGAANDSRRFSEVARYLTGKNFSAPLIHREDSANGLLLLEDLGDGLFARLSKEDDALEALLYESAVEFLVALHEAPPPEGLGRFDAKGLADASDLATIWYASRGTGTADPEIADAFRREFERLPHLSKVLVLRDFHAENLIWIQDRKGTARVGLLDFQDALIGHRAYDLVSLLQDARRDLSPDLADRMVARYMRLTESDAGAFRHAYALLGAQRNLRILGVFARLAMRDGKHRYLQFLPRVWGHLSRNLEHPDLSGLRALVADRIPEPMPAHLKDLAS